MKVLLDEAGHVSSYAIVGDIVGGIYAQEPEDIDFFLENYKFYMLNNGALIVDEPFKKECEDAAVKESYNVLVESTINEMSEICSATIINGIDVQLSDGNRHHYMLKLEDQIMLQQLAGKVERGATMLYYHETDGSCVFLPASDIMIIANAAEQWVSWHTTYFNSLRDYIRSLKTKVEFDSVFYGMEIPSDYQSDVLKAMIAGDLS